MLKKKRFRSAMNKILPVVVILLIVAIVYTGYRITETYQDRPDFGGTTTLRQADMGQELDRNSVRLTRSMILEYITQKDVLTPIAARNKWDVPYKAMLPAIDVKERLSSMRSFVVTVNTENPLRSQRIARELSIAFLNHYQKIWASRGSETVEACEKKIQARVEELDRLRETRQVFQVNKELHPVNSPAEIEAVNNQLLEAQKQFLSAYSAHITRMEAKRSDMQAQYDMACQIYTPNSQRLKIMKRQMEEIERQCDEVRRLFAKQKPNLYQMTLTPPALTGLPGDILYFYENVQTLQRLKLAMMIDTIIEEKEAMLEKERKKKQTVEQMLESNACDVFIREVGR